MSADSSAAPSAESSAGVFQHDPLPDKDGIRLVTILPDLVGDNIACRLEIFPGSSRPPYVAVSYLWGDPTPRHTVHINGQTRQLHENLWRFLRQMHEDGEPARLWIDSICLDQGSPAELAAQVPRMGDIYTQAARVYSWLGDEPHGVDTLRALMAHEFPPDEPEASVPRMVLSQLVGRDRWAARGVGSNSNGDPAPPEPDLAYFATLRYWSRVWVTQEVVCAAECAVVCGGFRVGLRDLAWALARMSPGGAACAKPTLDLCVLRETLTEEEEPGPHESRLVSLTKWALRCSSTLEVDRIYGLLGLFKRFDPDFNADALEVSYDKAKSLDDVFWDVACVSVERLSALQIVDFLSLMPKFRQAVTGRTGRLSSLGADLERYSTAATTADKCRAVARVALKIYGAVVSTMQHTIKSTDDTDAITDAWWTGFDKALHDKQFYGARARPPPPGPGRPAQSEGIKLALALVYEAARIDEAIFDQPTKAPAWYCATHRPEGMRAEANRVLSLPIPRFTAADMGISCAAAAAEGACAYATLSHEVAGEGIVMELYFLGRAEWRARRALWKSGKKLARWGDRFGSRKGEGQGQDGGS